ncbi:Nucleotidyltransferase substrate binding protein like [Parafannyhessea umbonata]|uniref:Nucleotidyltransferase substrate binding protein like n=1 Tax=Parafannyhessea umbonata TaxID=604330 RepID=A0A1G6MPX7_9ACTN|nr:nucleotidyltransferase substrate binding protein [Parafannyhessea umbonata]SDC57580.1 Nucleotidyltransferase substrate binding protein like [Parafannyhessea umbonata]
MINDEEGWLDALESRSLMSHAYDNSVALSIISKTREKYISIFQELERELKENWSLEE